MSIQNGRIEKGERKSIATEFKKGIIPKNFIGKWKDSYGYVCVYAPNHPNCNKRNMMKEHRLVMEKHIGRHLTKKEVIHHINGIKDDNRIENLMLLSTQASHLKIESPRQKSCNTNTQRMCQKCKIIKKLTEENFYKSKSAMHGFGYTCRTCNREYGIEQRAKHKK